MDKYIKGAIAGIISCLILYLVFAFGAWSLNPNDWDGEARSFCAFLFFVAMAVFAGFVPTIFTIEGK